MSLRDIVGIVVALLVNEACDVSPWIARKLVRWSARLRYTDTRRAQLRADELVALIDERPGKLFKLCTALGFIVTAGTVRMRRALATRVGFAADQVAQAMRAVRGDLTPHLSTHEAVRGQWRRHWVHLARELAIGTGATFLFGYLGGFAADRVGLLPFAATVVLWLLVIAWVSWRVVVWSSERFVLTDHRLMMITGLAWRRVTEMPLSVIARLVYTQTATERILAYGTFELKSSPRSVKCGDATQSWIKHVPNPHQVYLYVVNEFYGNGEEATDDSRQHKASN